MNTSRLASGFVLGLAAFMIFEWFMLAKNLGNGPGRRAWTSSQRG
jgi:hypothetical protein